MLSLRLDTIVLYLSRSHCESLKADGPVDLLFVNVVASDRRGGQCGPCDRSTELPPCAVRQFHRIHGGHHIGHHKWPNLGMVVARCRRAVFFGPFHGLRRDGAASARAEAFPAEREILIAGLGKLAAAASWAVLAWLLLGVADPMVKFSTSIVLAGMAAGAIGILAPFGIVGPLYITIVMVPVPCASSWRRDLTQ